MQATAMAHPNIALVKYWGKRDRTLNLPAVPSLSITLAPYQTRTTVEWGASSDEFVVNEVRLVGGPADRVAQFLDLVDSSRPPVRVRSTNNFPTAAGLASSSSAFAALALAATTAAGRAHSPTELSTLARQGSGSAARSIWGGWVVWRTGTAPDGSDSHGSPLAPPDHWDLHVVVAIASDKKKDIPSREGMLRTEATSPLYPGWVASADADLEEAIAAVHAKDLPRLGAVVERSSMKMHATMLSADPSIRYWKPTSVAILDAVQDLRRAGTPAWATMDAGPNVKVLTTPDHSATIAATLSEIAQSTQVLHIGGDARLVS
jgi:diphosphomevalonate decarboxylase